MARYVFVGQANAVAGREREYEEWYTKVHLPAVLQCHGVKSVRRFRPAGSQLLEPPHSYQYLAIFEVETDDPAAFTSDVMARIRAGQMPSSDATAPGSFALLWQEIVAEPGQG